MAETISSLICQPYSLTGAIAATVVEDGFGAGHSVDLITSGQSGTYRTILAKSAGTGTATDPYELLSIVDANLGSQWALTFTADGRIKVTYTGAVVNGAITWGSTTIRNLLGFDANVGPITAGSNGSQTGTYQPTHCAFLIARTDDTGWVPSPQKFALAEMPDGSVYGRGDNRRRLKRTFNARFLPVDYATRTTLSAASTPCFPAKSRWAAPSSAAGTSPPWSVYELLTTSHAQKLGCAFGTYQDLVNGSTTYDAAYWTAETVNADEAVGPTVANWSARRDWRGLSLWFSAEETR
jgi:hypothetical protein